MREITNLANQVIKYCNMFHIVFNVIFLVIITVLLIHFLIDEEKIITTKGKIKSIKNDKCTETTTFIPDKYGGHQGHNFNCTINVEYTDNTDIPHSIELNTTDKDHEVGETVLIDYSKEDPTRATYRSEFVTILFVLGILAFLLLSVGTFIRLFYKDNRWVRVWIGWTCFRDFIR